MCFVVVLLCSVVAVKVSKTDPVIVDHSPVATPLALTLPQVRPQHLHPSSQYYYRFLFNWPVSGHSLQVRPGSLAVSIIELDPRLEPVQKHRSATRPDRKLLTCWFGNTEHYAELNWIPLDFLVAESYSYSWRTVKTTCTQRKWLWFKGPMHLSCSLCHHGLGTGSLQKLRISAGKRSLIDREFSPWRVPLHSFPVGLSSTDHVNTVVWLKCRRHAVGRCI